MGWFERLMTAGPVRMDGRLALTRETECECLAHYVAIPGDHIEIGCLWGGTALIAALVKEDLGLPGEVFTIDAMAGGWWDTQDPEVMYPPTPGAVLGNLQRFGVAYRTHPIRAYSDPWPLPDCVVPATIFIDGDHSHKGSLADWRNARSRAQRYILFHDYAKSHPGVMQTVDQYARLDPGWKFVDLANSVAVFERV